MSAMTDHIPVVETDRLRLRAPKMGDLPIINTFFQTERSHMVGGPQDERECHRMMMSTIGSWALKGHGMWHIADKATDEYVGATGIMFAPGWHEPELGWNTVAKAEGKGIAFEAASAARRFAAQHLKLDGVISYIDPANPRSKALARRLGAEVEREAEFLGKVINIWRHPKGAA
jgi:RimJ/RimL family protein N-acetyltransferase